MMRTFFAWCCQVACRLLGLMLLRCALSLSLISILWPLSSCLYSWKLCIGIQWTLWAGLIREEASRFDAAAFARSSWRLHLGSIINVDFVACKPILLRLIRKRGVHKVCHIFVGISLTATNLSALSMFGREFTVRVAGLFDNIWSVLLLTSIFIDPFTSRIPLSLWFFRFLAFHSLVYCIELLWFRVPTLLKIRHAYVRIFWQLGHHEIDNLRAGPSWAFDIKVIFWGCYLGASDSIW